MKWYSTLYISIVLANRTVIVSVLVCIIYCSSVELISYSSVLFVFVPKTHLFI